MNGKVMVVDDDDSIRRMIVELLGSEGFECIEAANGGEALDFIERMSVLPSAVITDLQMDFLDGRELLKRIKSIERFRKIPVIVVTAHSDVFGMDEAFRVVAKPFNPDSLVALVYQAMAANRSSHPASS